jgi:hypothetical protein
MPRSNEKERQAWQAFIQTFAENKRLPMPKPMCSGKCTVFIQHDQKNSERNVESRYDWRRPSQVTLRLCWLRRR